MAEDETQGQAAQPSSTSIKSRLREKYEKLVSESETLSPEEARAKIVMELARTESPDLLSELSSDEINWIASLMTIAQKTNNVVISTYCNWFMRLRVSYLRQGRQELIKVSRSDAEVLDAKLKRNLLERFGGGAT